MNDEYDSQEAVEDAFGCAFAAAVILIVSLLGGLVAIKFIFFK